MNQAQYKQWVKELPSLNLAQLSDLSSRMKLLSKTAQKEHTGKQEFGDRLLQALVIIMKKHNVECPSVPTLRKSSAYVNAAAKLNDLAAYFETVSSSKLVQDAVLKEAIQLLYFDLVQWKGFTISSHTIIQQMHRLPATLNRHFPGYGASGLMSMIVKGADHA